MELGTGAVHDKVGDRGPAAKYEPGPLDHLLHPDDKRGRGLPEDDTNAKASEGVVNFGRVDGDDMEDESGDDEIAMMMGINLDRHDPVSAQRARDNRIQQNNKVHQWFRGQAIDEPMTRREMHYGNNGLQKQDIYSNRYAT